MTSLTGPLANALKRNRDAFNAKFAAAHFAGTNVDAEIFQRHLVETIDPIVRAVDAEFAEKTDAVTTALYDLSLDLVAKEILGAATKYPAVELGWRTVLPLVPKLLAREPARLAASVTNALYHLSTTPNARPAEWIDAMKQIGPDCQAVEEFLDCGKVVAWRAGLAQHRLSALEVSRRLRTELVAQLFALPKNTPATAIESATGLMLHNPWLKPEGAISPPPKIGSIGIVSRAGAFRGFGGEFLRPPTIAHVDGRFLATDGEGSWTLFADVFGAVFLRDRAESPSKAGARAAAKINPVGTIQWNGIETTIEALAKPSSVATDGTTLAVTIPTSHHVFLLAKVPATAD